jgi:hypothetical protein
MSNALWCRHVVSGIRWEDDSLVNQLKTLDARVDRFLVASVSYHATRSSAFARRTAPWTDRTSNARNGLFAKAERDRPKYRITISHSVPYGIWLETRFSGRFQVIRPTVDHESKELMQTVALLWQRVL